MTINPLQYTKYYKIPTVSANPGHLEGTGRNTQGRRLSYFTVFCSTLCIMLDFL